MKKFIASLMLGSTLLMAVPSLPAMANETGKKNTTIVTGAGSLLMFLTHHKTAGVAAGAAAVYSYSQYQREHQHNKRAAAYHRGYSQGRRDAHAR